MKKITIYFFVAFLLSITIFSCQDDDIEKEILPVGEAAGSWIVDFEYGGDVYEHLHLITYNTAFSDSLWIDDQGEFWDFQVKVKLDGNTFSVTDGKEYRHDDATTITDGQFVTKDSIYFVATFASDPENPVVVKGHRETGFEE